MDVLTLQWINVARYLGILVAHTLLK